MSTPRPFVSRWLEWCPPEKRRETPPGHTAKTAESDTEGTSVSFGSTQAARADPNFSIDNADIAAVLIQSTILEGLVWLVADDEALAESPDITCSGVPVFFFDEIPHLARLDAEGLRAVAACKRVFPTARILQ